MTTTDATKYNGGRVRALRNLYGYTQQELAELVGVSQARLSKLENGNAALDEDLVDELVERTSVPGSFFRVSDPLDNVEGSLRFRKTVRTRAKETARVRQFVLELYRATNVLADRLQMAPPPLPVVGPDRVVDDQSIEHLAERTREALGLPLHGPVKHVTRTLESKGAFVVPANIPGDVPGEALVGHSGASYWAAPWEHPLITYLPGQPGDRLRFTISHELGHLVLHSGVSMPYDRPTERESERQAHLFASAFLLPQQAAIEAFVAMGRVTPDGLKALKAGWGMSIAALVMRGRQVGHVSDDEARDLYRILSARGWRTVEPVRVDEERPELFGRVYGKVAAHMGPATTAELTGLPTDLLAGIIRG